MKINGFTIPVVVIVLVVLFFVARKQGWIDL
jgi:hypothetical protein